jgi:hypothetical protein
MAVATALACLGPSPSNAITQPTTSSVASLTSAPTYRSYLLDASDGMSKLEPGDIIRYSAVIRTSCIVSVNVHHLAITGPPLSLLVGVAPIDDHDGQPTPPSLLHKFEFRSRSTLLATSTATIAINFVAPAVSTPLSSSDGKESKSMEGPSSSSSTATGIAKSWNSTLPLTAPMLTSLRTKFPITPFTPRPNTNITMYTISSLPCILHYQLICDGSLRGAPATFEVTVTPSTPQPSTFDPSPPKLPTSSSTPSFAGSAQVSMPPPDLSMSASLSSPSSSSLSRSSGSDFDLDSDTDSSISPSDNKGGRSRIDHETNDNDDDDGVLIKSEDLPHNDTTASTSTIARDCIRVLEAVRLSSTQAALAARRRFPAPNRTPSLLDSKSAVKAVAMVSYITDWTFPQGAPIYTVYFQGAGASQTQLAKYVGSKGFLSTTGERVSIGERGIEVIHSPWIGRELEEIIPQTIARSTVSESIHNSLIVNMCSG